MSGEDLKRMIDEQLKERRQGHKKDFEPFPPSLKMSIGQTFEGLIVRHIETQKFGLTRVVIDREGNQFALPKSKAIVDELIRNKAGVGDYIYLHYSKDIPNKKNPAYNPFKAFDVVIIPKDTYAKTGDKFPEPKPVPRQEASQVPPAQAPQQSAQPAAAQAQPKPAESAVEKNVKRLADAVSKISGGMKVPQFERLFSQITGEAKTANDAVLDYPTLFQIAKLADGTEVVQKVQ